MNNKAQFNLVLKYAGLSFAIIVFFTIILPLFGSPISLSQNLMLIILGAEIYLCCNEYKRVSELELPFKKAFILGMSVSFFVGLFVSLVVFGLVFIAGKDLIKAGLYKNKSLILNGNDEAMFDDIVNAVSNPFIISISTIVLYLIMGIFLSLIVALFVKAPFSSIDEK